MEFFNFHLGDPNPGASDEASLVDVLSSIDIADVGGFTGFFVAEHHNDRHQSLMSRPALFLAHAAARTRHLRLGTMVTILGIHHPYFVAEEIAMLDSLSGGRLEYGFGGGRFGWEQTGLRQSEAKERLDEGIALIQRFLLAGRGEVVEYAGTFWSGASAGVVPDVVQRPLPPLWISGHSQSTIDQAARLGLNFCTGFVSHELVRARRAAYREAWNAAHGDTPPGRVGQMILACVGDSRREIEDVAMPAMKTKLYEFAQNTLGKRGDSSFTFERALRERFYVDSWDELVRAGIVVYGTEDQCIEQLAEMSERAGDAVLLQTRFGELDRNFCRESITRLATEVLPKIGGRPIDAALLAQLPTAPATVA
jgi:alkanesulfonate monooxygenase SsuD/methylene tetrahydromethanopterin reductase-like flavin-dependent oxidoreductase (luciferase family)